MGICRKQHTHAEFAKISSPHPVAKLRVSFPSPPHPYQCNVDYMMRVFTSRFVFVCLASMVMSFNIALVGGGGEGKLTLSFATGGGLL